MTSMHANDISHREAQRAAIASAVQAFEAAGGKVQKLDPEIPQEPELRTLRDVIEKNFPRRTAAQGAAE